MISKVVLVTFSPCPRAEAKGRGGVSPPILNGMNYYHTHSKHTH